jgi:putative ABC transport system substrate-binding protein
MRRREFIVGSSLFIALAATAQQPGSIYRIAIIHPADAIEEIAESGPPKYRAFFEEMRRLGYIEGGNIIIARYSAGGRADEFTRLAREVVRSRPDLIIVFSRRLLQHFKDATSTIPIVAGATIDPVGYGIAQSLARPGSNITGLTTDAGLDVLTKHIQLLREAVPSAKKIAWLAPTETWAARYGVQMQEAAEHVGVSLIGPGLDNPIREAEYRRVFAAIRQERADGLIVGSVTDNRTFAKVIVELAEQLRLPAIYPDRDFVEVGGLMAYANDYVALHRRIPTYVDRILKGENAADLPFYQPTEFQLIVNLKTARALGLAIPPTLLARADEVIE